MAAASTTTTPSSSSAASSSSPKQQQRVEIIASVIAYSLCSGTLVLLNKLILHFLPYPSLVTVVQLVAAIVFIYSASYCCILMPVDALVWKYVLPYLYYIAAFCAGVYCNMKSLSLSNVETIIVFRACAPCLVACLDFCFMGRQLPAARSWLGLLLIVSGAVGYARTDSQFVTQGMAAYKWPLMYLLCISFEMVYGKRILSSVHLKTRSGPVIYTNVLALLPMMLLATTTNEVNQFWDDRAKNEHPLHILACTCLFLGCVAGIGIGYSSWWCRGLISATSFTLLGVMNKCLTVLLNLVIWDKHAPAAGIASLLLCLLGGVIYRQAPMRSNAGTSCSAALETSSTTEKESTKMTELLAQQQNNNENDENKHLYDGGERGGDSETKGLLRKQAQ